MIVFDEEVCCVNHIVSCFDPVIQAVVKQFTLSSKEQLTHDGNEPIDYGFYQSEQMNLF